MVLAACEMAGGEAVRALPVAIGVEFLHNFTLIHDDIMDRSGLRRGKETVHVKYGIPAAILAGDVLFTEACLSVSKTDKDFLPLVLRRFLETTRQVCEGQQMDMDFETCDSVSLESYMEMIRLKTAVLLGASLELGAAMAGAGKTTMDACFLAGMHAGIGFQLMDDLLDVYGNQEKFGKPTGNDILQKKKTFLLISALERNQGRFNLSELLHDGSLSAKEKVEKITVIFNALEIKKLAEDAMNLHFSKAESALKDTGCNPSGMAFFKEFFNQLRHRNF